MAGPAWAVIFLPAASFPPLLLLSTYWSYSLAWLAALLGPAPPHSYEYM